jgi:alkaline phosphatase D
MHLPHLSRRDLLARLAAAGVLSVTPARLLRAADIVKFRDDPFTLGVASGYPTAEAVVLWTRLAPTPLAPRGGLAADVVPVQWELATDDTFRQVIRSGTTYADPDWAHSVHVEVTGLESARPYWYRFVAGGARSPVGRTRTAPRRDDPVARLRLAVASCQQYEHGYYAAYRHMCEDELDLVVHVGDYIYEVSWGKQGVRSHGASECHTLDDYRARYALYRSDRDLQSAHAAYPWLVTWDDHEVDNDYADRVSEQDDDPDAFLARRAGAYQAWYEHMPVPRSAVPFGPHLRLYTESGYGQLLNLYMLDERQYRSPQACPPPGRRGSNRVVDCAQLFAPERTKLGARQEAWLDARLAASKARWNVLAQGTVMAYVDEQPGPGERFWTDSWNGYPAARQRLLDALVSHRVSNPVVLSGDIHAFLAADLNQLPSDAESPVVAAEFTTTSISSNGLPQKLIDERKGENPSIHFANSEHRGYLRLDVTAERLQAEMIGLEAPHDPNSVRRIVASFAVDADRPGVQRETGADMGRPRVADSG